MKYTELRARKSGTLALKESDLRTFSDPLIATRVDVLLTHMIRTRDTHFQRERYYFQMSADFH